MSDIGDDTEDKIRRNLVAFSSIVILGAWLDIPLKAIADKALTSGALDQVTPWRVWVAVVAVQAYLILRFRFSAETLAEARMLRRAWSLIYRGRVVAVLHRHLAAFSKSQRESPFFPNRLTDVASLEPPHVALKAGGTKESLGVPSLIATDITFLDQARAPTDTDETAPPLEVYRGYVNLAFSWPGGASRMGGSTEFQVTGWRRYALDLTTLWTLCLYSPEAMKLILPSALALVAASIALFKLVASLFA